MFKRYLLTAAIAAALTACGGGGSSGGNNDGNNGGGNPGGGNPPPPSTSITVNGTASAPGGAVALLKQNTIFEIALNTLISPAAAAVIGLQPVNGATVELIRIDDTGAQIGDVLASTHTSITGDYTLTLPTGVDLSGDLIVRITGNSVEMRAQVVDQDVDISPVSEFVLRKFIASGTDLSSVTNGAVVKLSGKVAEFDLTATSDMTSMLAKLEAEVGAFVDDQLDVLASSENDASALDGNYRSTALSFGLHDSDGRNHGTFAVDLYAGEFAFDGNSDGSVSISHTGEEIGWGYVHGADNASTSSVYVVETDDGEETFPAAFDANNVLTIEGAFEEDIGDDWGWRHAPGTYRLQKVSDSNVFFQLSSDVGVRYGLTDTDNDGIKDAVDPNQREGDEISRALEVFVKKPTALSNADLNGTFGRVYFGTHLNYLGYIEVESETNLMQFYGGGTLDSGAAQLRYLTRNTTGEVIYDTSTGGGEEANIPFTVTADGNITSMYGAPIDGFVNDSADLIVLGESNGTHELDAKFRKTLMVKLPTSQLTVTGKTYRLMYLSTRFAGTSIVVGNPRFRSTITLSSNSAGEATFENGAIAKSSLGAEVVALAPAPATLPVSITVDANGHTVLELTHENGVQHLDGYLNATGSYGIFQTRFTPTSGDTNALGVAVLIEVTQ